MINGASLGSSGCRTSSFKLAGTAREKEPAAGNVQSRLASPAEPAKMGRAGRTRRRAEKGWQLLDGFALRLHGPLPFHAGYAH